MRVYRILKKTYAEGPGCRYCIWVQGCNHKCHGCFAKDLWDFNGGYVKNYLDIIDEIGSVKDDICGITLLGGEPFEYSEELQHIAKYAHSIGKSVITFTGYTYENLLNIPDAVLLLNETDLLIDGKFDQSKEDYSRPLVGSSNQRFIFLTNRIKENDIKAYKNRFEFRISENGKFEFNGMGNISRLKEFLKSEDKDGKYKIYE